MSFTSGGGGLLSKAASGFEEKVKSGLTAGTRSDGGLGSKMLGAKAGGGLLRRLAGR
jgi:hypothetical protein